MSESLFPAKPAEITLDTLPQLFAHHRARFGGFFMEGPTGAPAAPAAPERPEGISEEEWTALGDPGRNALAREREARQTAERALAASRARPTPPAAPPAPAVPAAPAAPAGGEQDIASLIQQAVAAAVKPFADRETERETERKTQAAAERIQQSVLDAAKDKLHDPSDVLANVDLTTVVNDKGEVDAAKVTTALEDLVKRKPHLAKSATRLAPPGIGGGAPASATDAERVKAVLADMQRATGVRPPSSNS